MGPAPSRSSVVGGNHATEVVDLLADLVAIPSVNPGLVEGAPGEGAIAEFIATWLEGRGANVVVSHPSPGRPNVVAEVEGATDGPTLMLNAHTDTVGVEGMDDAFKPVVRDGRMYGRGACDTKGGLAGLMVAAARLAEDRRFAGRVLLTAVCDEEHGSVGTEAIAEECDADGAIVAEPSSLRLCVRHKGFAWFRFTSSGIAAHGSLADEGRDAIAAMGSVVTEISALSKRLLESGGDALLGTGTIHASLISGGTEMSTYPAVCTLDVERRTLPGETPETLEREMRTVLDRAREADPELDARFEMTLFRSPLGVSENEPVVAAIQAAAQALLGEPASFMGGSGWTDAALLADAGIPAVICGPSGDKIHTPDEWVDLASVETYARLVELAAREFCR